MSIHCGCRWWPVALALAWLVQPAAAATIYWSTGQGGLIQRAATSGAELQTVVASAGSARSIALDIESGYIYWAESQSAKIRRAWLDGSHAEDLIAEGLERPSSLALDVAGGKLYFLDSQAGAIGRANLDGTGVEPLTTQVDGSSSLALDLAAGKLYWTNVGAGGSIRRANFDGADVETVASNTIGFPSILVLDPAAGLMFWTNFDAQAHAGANINRAQLDGSHGALVAPDVAGGLAIDTAAGKLYWSALPGGGIVEANFDGSSRQPLFAVPGVLPIALAIDNSVRGDANFDRLVTLADYAVLQEHYGSGTRRSQADFTGDHRVDLQDFAVFKHAYSAAAAVPEPGSLVLALAAAVGWWLARRRG